MQITFTNNINQPIAIGNTDGFGKVFTIPAAGGAVTLSDAEYESSLPQFNALKAAGSIAWTLDNSHTQNGKMVVARHSHSATLLGTGAKVLIVGGCPTSARSGPVKTAEIYDLATGKSVATGSMATARFDHQATLLDTGKVLITGGVSTYSPLTVVTTCEIWDPATGLFTPAPSMAVPRALGQTVKLLSGKVIVAGGHVNNGAPVVTTELYDPVDSVWTTTCDMNYARASDTQIGALLSTGEFMVTGGWKVHPTNAAFAVPASLDYHAEAYNEESAVWGVANMLNIPRAGHSLIQVEGGNLVILGGDTTATGDKGRAEVYNLTQDTWTLSVNAMATPRNGVSAAILGESVLAYGGYSGSLVTEAGSLGSAEAYVSHTNGFVPIQSSAVNPQDGQKWYRATALSSGKVLISGGYVDGKPAATQSLSIFA